MTVEIVRRLSLENIFLQGSKRESEKSRWNRHLEKHKKRKVNNAKCSSLKQGGGNIEREAFRRGFVLKRRVLMPLAEALYAAPKERKRPYVKQ